MHDLIVIGSGPGGYEAAAHAGRMGKKVLLFEKGQIGGTCLNVGCIPTKTLLKSTHVLNECREADAFGVQAGAAKLDLAKVQERKRAVVAALTKGVEGLLKKAGVEVAMTEAKVKGKGCVVAGGKEYQAAHILLAAGSRPARPPVPGLDGEKVLDSTGALALEKLPASLVVIGGGVIGLEFATFFCEAGCAVTVIEMLPHIAAGIDGEIAKRLLAAMKKKGVKFHLECRVTKVEGGKVCFTDKDGAAQEASGEYVLNATGRAPVTDGLGLAEAGVELNRRGVVTSPDGRTSVPGIWACGDVTGRCLLAHAATREGLVAVNNMFGAQDRMRYEAVPGVVYSHPEVASVGKTEEQLSAEGVAYRKGSTPMAVAGRFSVEYPGESGTIKVLAGEEHGEILGVHMIGGACGELIFGAALMIENEMRAADVAGVIFPHPTVSEALKEAVIHL